MVTYNYAIAKDALNESEKERIIAIFLNSDPPNCNWAKATKEFGFASVESMKKTLANSLKKIEKAGGKDGDDTGEGTSTPAKPVATPKKRKAGGEDAGEEEKPKAKRGRGRPKKAVSESENVAEGAGGAVKEEE